MWSGSFSKLESHSLRAPYSCFSHACTLPTVAYISEASSTRTVLQRSLIGENCTGTSIRLELTFVSMLLASCLYLELLNDCFPGSKSEGLYWSK